MKFKVRPQLFITVIALALIALNVFFQHRASYYKQQYEQATAKYERVKANEYKLDHQQRQFIGSLAEELNFKLPDLEKIELRDVFRIVGNLKVVYNKLIEPRYPQGFYKMQSALTSPTRSDRNVDLENRTQIELNSSPSFDVESNLETYKYEIANISDRPAVAPILYDQFIWNSTQNIVDSARFKSIANETDRAIAIWQFLSKNRYHWDPVTTGPEEVDIVRYLSVYGRGFCGESALILAKLADEVGLQGRVWKLEGHVVPEVYADGRWMLLDPDFHIYFHESGNPKAIYSVEQLSTDKAAFDHFVFMNEEQSFLAFKDRYIEIFMSTDNNELADFRGYDPAKDNLYAKKYTAGATSDYVIQDKLRPGEKIVFTNFNWGRYFLGIYAERVPKFFNGYYEYWFSPKTASKISKSITIEETETSYKITNKSPEAVGTIAIENQYAFPIVGGAIRGKVLNQTGSVSVVLDDKANQLTARYDLDDSVDTSAFFNIIALFPTYAHTVTLELAPGADVEIRKDFKVISDFQFAEFALWKPKSGSNPVHVYYPKPQDADRVRLDVYW